MGSSIHINRRSFIKTLACGTVITLSFSGLPINILPRLVAAEKNGFNNPMWAPVPGVATMRIDGIPKVLGHKIYARDFHASDLEGWPSQERFLYALRVDKVDQIINGYDLSILPSELKPMNIIDHAKIINDNMDLAGGMEKPFFVENGKLPDHYGQPVAILIFENFNIYRKAKSILQFNDQVIQYGERQERVTSKNYTPASAYVRNDEEKFNYVNNVSDYDQQFLEIAAKIETEIEESNWNIFERQFKSQTMDPVFLEPEAGLAWYDKMTGDLKLLLGTQSPSGDLSKIADIFGNEKCSYPLNSVDLTACYPGGGFGGRDDSYFPKYLALCAPYADGPVRWIYDRYEQFQVGLKRHETNFFEQIAIDNEGTIKAIKSNYIMNGGGRRNLSPYVAQLAAMSSCNSYEIKKAVSHYKAIDTPDVIGGSQRGFGGPQAFIAIETLLDEAAEKLTLNPFDIRRKNLLDKKSKIITGAPINQDLQLVMILDELESQPLWQSRYECQKNFEKSGLRYGVGLALSNQAYGNEGDGMFGAVEIDKDGSIYVRTPYIDMGNGAATGLALAPATYMGRNASGINMGEVACFDALDLTTSYYQNPNIFMRALTRFGFVDDTENDKYVSFGSGASSACLAAFHQFHAIEQAGLTLLIQSILPAARKVWNVSADYDQVRWQKGNLVLNGQRPISWNVLVKTIIEEGLPTATAVHASFMAEFIKADFEFYHSEITLPLDYIAMGFSLENLKPLNRKNIIYPSDECRRYGRSTFAPCGALVAASIDPKNNAVQIEDCVSVLSAGKQLCPELISGQSQGGISMAIGYVLMENCPNSADGPGNGTWNLDQYSIPSQQDMPKKQKLIILDPPKGEQKARGIAEAVMCPIPPAILNALSMATNGHRFSRLPVTADDIKKALS